MLPGAGLAATRLRTSHAFHTSAMADASRQFRAAFADVELAGPRWTVYSAAAGGPVDAAQATDPDFWVRQLTEPVWFGRALDAVLSDSERVLVEVGPGRTLTTLARGHAQVRARKHVAVPSLPARQAAGDADRGSMLQAVARLWTLGTDVTWSALTSPGAPGRLALPGYPYERARYWAGQASADGPVAAPARATHTADGRALLRLPTWVEGPPAGPDDVDARDAGHALVFLPDDADRAGETGFPAARGRPGGAGGPARLRLRGVAGRVRGAAGSHPGRRTAAGGLAGCATVPGPDRRRVHAR